MNPSQHIPNEPSDQKGRRVPGWGNPLLAWELLRGRLSLVGSEITEETGEAAGFKPGLTGLVQVRGGEDTDADERDRLRLYYMKHYSILLDVEILLRSIFKF